MTATEELTSEGAIPLEEATSVLLLAPSMSHGADDACTSLLTRDDPAETDVLYVTFRGPDQPLSTWRDRVDGWPAEMAVVAADGSTRNLSGTQMSTDSGGVHVHTVSDPNDLTGLGIAIQQTLETWQGDGNHVAVCVRSLTTLLQFAETRRAFRFFHVLLAQLRAIDARLHAHLDPTAVDDRTVATFRSLFDAVVSVS